MWIYIMFFLRNLICIILFYSPFAKAKPQTSHLNGLSPEWSLLWDQSDEYLENVPSHTLQWNGFSAWFWLFCLPPVNKETSKFLVFLKGPVLQKDTFWDNWLNALKNSRHWIVYGFFKNILFPDTFKREFEYRKEKF